MAEATLPQKLLVTACAITRSTDLVTRWTGAAPFLPALFVLRYANMGGLDQTEFTEQIRAARSFRDDRWCGYWNPIADAHARRATELLRSLAGTDSTDVPDLAGVGVVTAAEHLDGLTAWIAPAAELFADHGPQPDTRALTALADEHAATADRARVTLALNAIDAWAKAITYYQVSAFPGHDTHRMQAYWRSRHLFDALIGALAPTLGLTVDHV
ncbi:MAG: hypothetical protein K0R33_3089, partial [Mycobacterium sp.]|nr:hypothetical protein [Mycobacterium sp.]